MTTPIKEYARAKINLTLHVGRIITDSSDPFYHYHPLDSLVVFADIADELSALPAETTTLTLTGPFSSTLEAEPDNLILRAYNAVAREADIPALAFTLVKNLPVSSGIGGGSADAAAVLRILQNYVSLPAQNWAPIALGLGADVPLCLFSQTAHMTGIGETVRPWPGLGIVHGLLVNPGVPVSTRDIFRSFDAGASKETPRPQKHEGDLLSRALSGHNDLQSPAIDHAPEITDVLRAIANQTGCQLARMSGSGATCFGLFERQDQALHAADILKEQYPIWWVQATQFGDYD